MYSSGICYEGFPAFSRGSVIDAGLPLVTELAGKGTRTRLGLRFAGNEKADWVHGGSCFSLHLRLGAFCFSPQMPSQNCFQIGSQ